LVAAARHFFAAFPTRRSSDLGPYDRLRRVHHYRRGKPIGRESGFHVYGASRPEGIRTVIPLSFSSTQSAASLPANGLPAAARESCAARCCLSITVRGSSCAPSLRDINALFV